MKSPKLQMSHAPELDGIRGIAVLIVIVSHAGLGNIVPGGFGVTTFFFLSGYLITSLLRSEYSSTGAIDMRSFYIRRTLRIFPPLYITLIVVLIANHLGFFQDKVSKDAIVWDFLFLSNYSHLWGQEGGLPIPLWSLAVEEHFYLIFPVLYVVYLKSRHYSFAAVICSIACIAILCIRIGTALLSDDMGRNYYWSHTRIDSILFGCCLALWNNPLLDKKHWKPKYLYFIIAIAGIVLSFVIRDQWFRETIRYTLQGACLFIIFSFILSGRSKLLSAILSSKILYIVGLLSYTLYLIHFPIYVALEGYMPDANRLVIGLLGAIVAVAYAALMRILVEKPILRWRRARERSFSSTLIAERKLEGG